MHYVPVFGAYRITFSELRVNLTSQSFENILHHVYHTVEDKTAWRHVLDSLNDALETRAVHLLAFDGNNGCLSYSDGANMAASIDLEYLQTYQFIDPRVGRMRADREDAWMHCHKHFSDEFVAHDPFYQEFLLPNGARYLSACKLMDTEVATVILACLRSAGDGPLPEAAVAFIDRLRPHLSRACRLGVAQFVYSHQALVGHMLVDQLRQPVILATTSAEVVHSNAVANALLDSTGLMRVEQGRIMLPLLAAQRFLDECATLERTLRYDSGAASASYKCLHVASQGRDDGLYLFFKLLMPDRLLGTFGQRPLVLIMLYHPRSCAVVDHSLLRAAFGMTHAECRVAALLGNGMHPKQIAAELNVQYETVRKQLASVYRKTATARQAELIRLLLHMPAGHVDVAVHNRELE